MRKPPTGFKPLEHLLRDALEELGSHSAIDDTPSSIADYDAGTDTAEAIAKIAGEVYDIALNLVIERAKYRDDFVQEQAEKALTDDERYGVKNADFA